MKKTLILLISLITALSLTACNTQPGTEGWKDEALVKELYVASPYSAAYSPLVDTYLIACGLYYDFESPFLFDSGMQADYGETIEYFTPFKNHAFVQGLGAYVDAQNATASMNVYVPLLQYAISMTEEGSCSGSLQSYAFQSDQAFYDFLDDLQQFYLDTQAEAFFEGSAIHRQLERQIQSEINTVPVTAYFNLIEEYTGTKDRIFGGTPLRYTSLLSVYKSPNNATFHHIDLDEVIVLVSFQSPFGFDGSFDISSMMETTVHESLHPFINPGVEQQQEWMQSLSQDKNPRDYASLSYTEMPWHRITDEAVVRVVQARIYGAISQDVDATAMELLEKEVQSGWANLYAMCDSLADYEENREQYPAIDDYLPVLIGMFYGEG